MRYDKMTESKFVSRRSLINKYFTKEMYIDLLKITMMNGVDNNSKYIWCTEYLKEKGIPIQVLGSGTNRFGIIIDGYAFKIALDKDGMIDNKREFLYTKELYPRVIKVYECIPSGLISVSEYVEIFSIDDFIERKDDMRRILNEIYSAGFLLGDVGISSKNYYNWGIRADGSICIMDFAYIYDTKFNTFVCRCGDMLRYDADFNDLICPNCGEKYTFGNVRRRITRKMQAEEIGDIRRLGYNLTKDIEEIAYNDKFEPVNELLKKNKKEKRWKTMLREIDAGDENEEG